MRTLSAAEHATFTARLDAIDAATLAARRALDRARTCSVHDVPVEIDFARSHLADAAAVAAVLDRPLERTTERVRTTHTANGRRPAIRDTAQAVA